MCTSNLYVACMEDIASTPTPKKAITADIIKEIREMRQGKENFRAKVLKILEEKEERGMRREKLAEKNVNY